MRLRILSAIRPPGGRFGKQWRSKQWRRMLAAASTAVAALALVGAGAIANAGSTAGAPARAANAPGTANCTDFKMWYSSFTRIYGHPDFEAAGLQQMDIINASWWPRNGNLQEGELRDKLRKQKAKGVRYLTIDIEAHPITDRYVSENEAEANRQVHYRVAEIIREELPQVKFGWYGSGGVSTGNHHGTIYKGDPAALAKYRDWNDQAKPVIAEADFLVSNLYTLDDNQAMWESVAEFKSSEARRLFPSREYFPFLKYLYNKHIPEFAWDPIPKAYLKFQMETLLRLDPGEGLVFWEGGVRDWGDKDEDTKVWPAVTEFIAENDLCPPGSTPSPTPSPTMSPPSGGLVADLSVNDSANAADWSVQANLQVGDNKYGDRGSATYDVASVPAQVAGAEWIRTANDSKDYTASPVATFTTVGEVTAYVAHSDHISVKPSWLSGWADTGLDMTQGNGDVFSLLSRTFTAGASVQLGVNGAGNTGMYTVIVTAAAPAPTPSPTTTIAPPANKKPVPVITVSSCYAAWHSCYLNGYQTRDPDGGYHTTFTYVWNFGDGKTGTGISKFHDFGNTGGTYTVTLTVTDDEGTKATTTKQVAVP